MLPMNLRTVPLLIKDLCVAGLRGSMRGIVGGMLSPRQRVRVRRTGVIHCLVPAQTMFSVAKGTKPASRNQRSNQ